MWANMAYKCGKLAADDPRSYESDIYANRLLQMDGKRLLELRWLFAIPNGGERAPSVAASMVAEGAKRGVADCFLPVPKGIKQEYTGGFVGDHHGLFIEMKKDIYRKSKDGGLSSKQLDFKFDMLNNGYAVVVCYTWLEARNAIMQYLGLEHGTKGLSQV